MSKPLTISELAQRTGVSAATLRAWESRHGFPTPQRQPGGHRRYQDSDVTAIEAVLAQRATGSTLQAAITRAQAKSTPSATSLFAALTYASEPLPTQVVSKRTMLALSRAIEDECSSAAERGVLVGAFQERRFYQVAAPRWHLLARGARYTVAFADFPTAKTDEQPACVPIAPHTPLEREWLIAHLAARTSVLLVGREQPNPSPSDSERKFELCWSVEPGNVRRLLSASAQLATETAPSVAQRLQQEIEATPHTHRLDPQFISSLTIRTARYLDRRVVLTR